MTDQNPFNHALLLLSQREHSTKELQQKLTQKGYDADSIQQVTRHLIELNYLNDARFAEVFCRNRAAKPYGKQRIQTELRMKGIDDETVKQVFQHTDIDWYELARELKSRKFGDTVAKDFKEKSKQTRYLLYRGFSYDEVKYALEAEEL